MGQGVGLPSLCGVSSFLPGGGFHTTEQFMGVFVLLVLCCHFWGHVLILFRIFCYFSTFACRLLCSLMVYTYYMMFLTVLHPTVFFPVYAKASYVTTACVCPGVTVCSVVVNYGEETLGISYRNENLSFLPLGVQSQRNG